MNKNFINQCKRVALLLTIGVGVGFATAGQAHADALSFGDNGGNQQISAQDNSNFTQDQRSILHTQKVYIESDKNIISVCLKTVSDLKQCDKAKERLVTDIKQYQKLETEFSVSNNSKNSRNIHDITGDM